LLNLLLSLRVELIHSIYLSKNERRIVATRARVSNQTPDAMHRTFKSLQKSTRSQRAKPQALQLVSQLRNLKI
jgi:hypothetical protein